MILYTYLCTIINENANDMKRHKQLFQKALTEVKNMGVDYSVDHAYGTTSSYLTIYTPDGMDCFEFRFADHKASEGVVKDFDSFNGGGIKEVREIIKRFAQ